MAQKQQNKGFWRQMAVVIPACVLALGITTFCIIWWLPDNVEARLERACKESAVASLLSFSNPVTDECKRYAAYKAKRELDL